MHRAGSRARAPCRQDAARHRAIAGGNLVGKDLAEQQILDLLDRYPNCKLVLSPIGAQGSCSAEATNRSVPAVIRRIGADNIIVVSTPAKLIRTPLLRFDTGDATLDTALISRKFFAVIVGYHRNRMVKVAG